MHNSFNLHNTDVILWFISEPCLDSCPEVYAPICGSDGTTYNNKCKLKVANCKDKSRTIIWAFEGTCQSQPGYRAGKLPPLWKEDKQPNLKLTDVNN